MCWPIRWRYWFCGKTISMLSWSGWVTVPGFFLWVESSSLLPGFPPGADYSRCAFLFHHSWYDPLYVLQSSQPASLPHHLELKIHLSPYSRRPHIHAPPSCATPPANNAFHPWLSKPCFPVKLCLSRPVLTALLAREYHSSCSCSKLMVKLTAPSSCSRP